MRRVYYNKLVRDGIKDKIERKGEACEVREITNTDEFEQELLKKVTEEAHALAHVQSRDEFIDEYADLMAVLDALLRVQEFSEAEVRTAIEENIQRKGGFSKRHFLHWSEATDYVSNESPQGIA